jgi:acetolactate synthase-1/3 small subunit
MPARADVVLRLRVRNHPGVMSHVCGLFARRAFNVEGIICLPVDDGTESAVLLLVHDDDRLEQLTRQLAKLEDVRAIVRTGEAAAAFAAAAALLSTERSQPIVAPERSQPIVAPERSQPIVAPERLQPIIAPERLQPLSATDQSSQRRNGPA